MHLGFLVHYFLTARRSSIFGAPPFWKVSRPPGAAQTPQIDDFRSIKTILQAKMVDGFEATWESNRLSEPRAALHTGCLKAVLLEIFGPVFPGFSAEADRRDPF